MHYFIKTVLLFFVSLLLLCCGNYTNENQTQQESCIQNTYQKVVLVTQNFSSADISLSENNNNNTNCHTHLKFYRNNSDKNDLSSMSLIASISQKLQISNIVENNIFIRAP